MELECPTFFLLQLICNCIWPPKMDPDTEMCARPYESVFDLRQIERISCPLAPHDKLIRDRGQMALERMMNFIAPGNR